MQLLWVPHKPTLYLSTGPSFSATWDSPPDFLLQGLGEPEVLMGDVPVE